MISTISPRQDDHSTTPPHIRWKKVIDQDNYLVLFCLLALKLVTGVCSLCSGADGSHLSGCRLYQGQSGTQATIATATPLPYTCRRCSRSGHSFHISLMQFNAPSRRPVQGACLHHQRKAALRPSKRKCDCSCSANDVKTQLFCQLLPLEVHRARQLYPDTMNLRRNLERFYVGPFVRRRASDQPL